MCSGRGSDRRHCRRTPARLPRGRKEHLPHEECYHRVAAPTTPARRRGARFGAMKAEMRTTAALLLVLALSACSSENTNPDPASTDAGTGGAGGGGGAQDSGSDAVDWCKEPFCPTGVKPNCCNCVQLECAAEFNGCRCSQDCRDLSDCLRQCTDPNCESACYAAHTSGTVLYGPFLNCADQSCHAECYN